MKEQFLLGVGLMALQDLGTKSLDELHKQTALLQSIQGEVAALNHTLEVGLEGVQEELSCIREKVSLLKVPVETEAANHCKIGFRLLHRGYIKEAERKLLEARSKDPSNFTIYLGLGQTYVRADKLEEALSYFRHAERNADSPQDKALASLMQGRALMSLGRLTDATDRFVAAVAFNPEDGKYPYALAQCHGEAGEAKLCCKALGTAINNDPYNFYRALADPLLKSVKAEVWEFCRRRSVAACKEAEQILDRVRSQLGSFAEQELHWYIPKTYNLLEQLVDELSAPLDAEYFLPSVHVIKNASKLSRRISEAFALAEDNKVDHDEDFRRQWFGGIGRVVWPMVLWSILASLVLGTLGLCFGALMSKGQAGPLAGGFVLGGSVGILLIGLIYVPSYILNTRKWRSQEFIESRFRDD